MENQLSKFSVTEIKALVYDELAKAEQAQANIRILNEELRTRLQPPDLGYSSILTWTILSKKGLNLSLFSSK